LHRPKPPLQLSIIGLVAGKKYENYTTPLVRLSVRSSVIFVTSKNQKITNIPKVNNNRFRVGRPTRKYSKKYSKKTNRPTATNDKQTHLI